MMSSIYFFLVASLFLAVSKNLQRGYVEALINGTAAQSAAFPYMLELMTDKKKHVCLAGLLDKVNAITAARCLDGFSSKKGKTGLKLRGGGLLLKQTSTQPFYQVRDVHTFFVHPEYKKGNSENDLAILKIDTPFMGSVDSQEYPRAVVTPKKGRCKFASWVDEHGKLTKLRSVSLYLAQKCSKKVDNTICATSSSKNHAGLCEGDYGGPILCGGKISGVFIGPAEACNGAEAIFTDISQFEDWTLDTLYGK